MELDETEARRGSDVENETEPQTETTSTPIFWLRDPRKPKFSPQLKVENKTGLKTEQERFVSRPRLRPNSRGDHDQIMVSRPVWSVYYNAKRPENSRKMPTNLQTVSI